MGALIAVLAAAALLAAVLPASAGAQTLSKSRGELDCNGNSPTQQALRTTMNCTDVRGFANVHNANNHDGRFFDNGTYIGHDEPDLTFLSSKAGSGDNVTWTETLGTDPAAAPTVGTPGSDVTHFFELTPAPWFSMAMCDPNSYPQASCKPQSDKNAPAACTISPNPCANGFQGGGSAFMEMQFYPPGFSPFVDSISCDNTHWCAALTIDSLECTFGFATCNPNCEEPVNFAFIQRDGVPAGAPSPQNADLVSETPNAQTLLMNQGDRVTVHMFDAPVPGHPGVKAFEVVINDLTTGQSGFMQASAANGFMNSSITDCSGTPFNFQPEYNSAAKGNIVPWAALATNISTQFEIGHFEPCTSVTGAHSITLAAGITDTFFSNCQGPYEDSGGADGANDPEVSDAPCYQAGDTHGALNTPPDTVTGCILEFTQNGDLDFNGSPYWADWPTGSSPTATTPGSFVQNLPSTGGSQYKSFFIQTDLALSESTCTSTTTSGCAVPAPNSPGQFYPYWSRVSSGSSCTLEFGNVSAAPGINDFGQAAQYGTNQLAKLGYPEFEGPVMSNRCGGGGGHRHGG